MMQDLRPEIEAINEEMRNVSTFIFFSSPCSLYGIFVGFTGYAIMLYYFTMDAFQSTDPRSMEVGKQKLGELFIRYAALYIHLSFYLISKLQVTFLFHFCMVPNILSIDVTNSPFLPGLFNISNLYLFF